MTQYDVTKQHTGTDCRGRDLELRHTQRERENQLLAEERNVEGNQRRKRHLTSSFKTNHVTLRVEFITKVQSLYYESSAANSKCCYFSYFIQKIQ